jgi:hypothetical protein
LLDHAVECPRAIGAKSPGLRPFRLRNSGIEVRKTGGFEPWMCRNGATQDLESAHHGPIGPLPITREHFETVGDNRKDRPSCFSGMMEALPHLAGGKRADLCWANGPRPINDCCNRYFCDSKAQHRINLARIDP